MYKFEILHRYDGTDWDDSRGGKDKRKAVPQGHPSNNTNTGAVNSTEVDIRVTVARPRLRRHTEVTAGCPSRSPPTLTQAQVIYIHVCTVANAVRGINSVAYGDNVNITGNIVPTYNITTGTRYC